MAQETQYTANTGLVKISTANSNLDGTGTLGTVITGASNGTLIKQVIIKGTDTGATANAEGMVRLFVDTGGSVKLLTEVHVPPSGQAQTVQTFEAVLPLNFKLSSGYILKASTQNADGFNVIAEGLDYAYYGGSVRPESTNYTANTGVSSITANNTALDGSGTVATLVTAGASGSGWLGLAISSISIKAYADIATAGMVRLFIQNTSTGAANTFLFREIDLPIVDATGTSQSFHHAISFPDFLQIKAGYKIVGALQIAISGGSLATVVDGMDWKYPA